MPVRSRRHTDRLGRRDFNCIEHALAALGLEPPPREALRPWIGPPLWHSFAGLLGDDATRIEQAIALYRQRFLERGWREHRVYAGIEDAIATLCESGHELAIVTSKPRPQAERIVATLPFGPRFSHLYGPEPDNHDHGKAMMIADALRDFSASPAETVMIGDRRFDIEGARANDVTSIGVLWGFGDTAELEAAGASVLAAAPSALPSLITALPDPV